MTKANECTCPSGDGSLRWPCPKHPAVEHERAEFEAWVRRDWPGAPLRFIRDALPVNDPRYGQYCDDALQRAWVGWQARAALAQPSPAIAAAPTYQFQSREIGESDWAPCDFRWYLYCSKSPEMDTRVVEVAAQPSPAQAEQAEAERPEVVAWQYRVTAGPQTGWSLWHPGKGEEFERSYTVERRPLMTVAQHDRIVGELRAVIAQLRQHKNDYMDSGQETYRALQNEIREREAEIARLDGLVSGRTAERDAALARVASLESKLAELEKQDLVDVPGPDEIHQMAFEEGQPADDGDGYLFSAEEFDLFVQRLLDSCAAPVAQAQHSVPDDVETFLDEVRAELLRARSKFPGDRIMTIALAEEFGELCKAVLDEPAANVRKEAVQTAVMAARVVLDGDGSVTAWRAERGLDPLAAAPAQGGRDE